MFTDQWPQIKWLLVWDGPGFKGALTVSNVYNLLVSFEPNPLSWWHHKIWRWRIPLKLKCFLWLCFHNKILTRDIIMKRGFCGTDMCFMCREAAKDNHHLFYQCYFVREVWQAIRRWTSGSDLWLGRDLLDCSRLWFERMGTTTLFLSFLSLAFGLPVTQAFLKTSFPRSRILSGKFFTIGMGILNSRAR